MENRKYVIGLGENERAYVVSVSSDGMPFVRGIVDVVPYEEYVSESGNSAFDESEAYDKGFKAGIRRYKEHIQDADYRRGLKDMYEKIHKVLEMPLEDKRICFGETYTNEVIKRYNATTFVSLLNAYERKKQEEQITIGDEVVFYNGEKCVVTVVEDGQVTEVMDENGFSMKMDDGLRNSMKKTGRHFEELVTILKKMKGE